MQMTNKWVDADGITTLIPHEINDPVGVFKAFCMDYSLLAMKELFSTMTDLCVMAEDVCAPKATARQKLFTLSTRITKVLEAVYLIARRDDTKPTANETPPALQEFRHVRVYHGRGTRESPLLTFTGKWLYEAGFHIGDEVQIAIEPGRLILTVSRRWSRKQQAWRIWA